MNEKMIESKQSCVFALQSEDHSKTNRGVEEKGITGDSKHLSCSCSSMAMWMCGRKKWGTSELIRFECSFCSTFGSVPEASGYFCRGDLHWCSDNLLFTLWRMEGSCSLKARDGWTHNTWYWTDVINSSLLVIYTLNKGQDTVCHADCIGIAVRNRVTISSCERQVL